MSNIPGGERRVKTVKKELENIDYTIRNEKLTGTEERNLLKEMGQLKKALPDAEKYLALQAEKNTIMDQRRPIMQELKPLFKERDELNKIIDEIKEKNEAEKAERIANGEVVKDSDGKVDRPKDKMLLKIDELRDQRSALFEKLKTLDKKYDEDKEKWLEFLKVDEVRQYIVYRQGRLRADIEY